MKTPKINSDKKNILLNDFRNHIRYPYNDQDEKLWNILNISWLNILNQYLQLNDDFILNEENESLIYDERVLLATFALATTFFENPDIVFSKSETIIDNLMIQRILGSLMNYE